MAPSTDMFLRRALPADDDAVYAVHEAAFGRSLEAELFAALRRDGSVRDDLSFVVVEDGEVVGSVVTSIGHVGARAVPAVGPLGVLPSWQRRGAGSALMHAVTAAADALGEPCVVLLGSPAYYQRFGYGNSSPVVSPDAAWGEAFQVRRLTGWDDGVRGVFRYAAAFS